MKINMSDWRSLSNGKSIAVSLTTVSFYAVIFTIQYPVPLFSLCTKSLIAVLKDAKQLSEENGGGPFC